MLACLLLVALAIWPGRAAADLHEVTFAKRQPDSTDLRSVGKWRGALVRHRLDRLRCNLMDCEDAWRRMIRRLGGLPRAAQVAAINDLFNRQRFVSDRANWGVADYWATPAELMRRGGDCEDVAIAKYLALRAVGVPANDMRIVAVRDLERGVGHSLLALRGADGAVLLDSLSPVPLSLEALHRYRPVYAVSETGWWLYPTRH